jgi:hypothetical protein
MIIKVEDRFCKVAKAFSKVLEKLERAAERGNAVHEVEETTWGGLIEVGREMIAGYIKKQEQEVSRPEVIEHEGKKLRRLPKRRMRPYVSVFGPTPFRRDVYATRETQRQEVVPLDAKLGMPEGNTSYLLQKWSGTKCVKESYQESRATLLEILGFAPSVNCLEDIVARAAEHAEVYFDEQEPVDPATEAEILVATSDCKGVPMRHVDAPQTKPGHDVSRPRRKRLKKGEKNGQKRMACVGGVYSVAPFRRTADDVLKEMLLFDCGVLCLGTAAFYALGAYVSALLAISGLLSVPAALLVASALVAAAAVCIGAIFFRFLRGDIFALATLGLAQAPACPVFTGLFSRHSLPMRSSSSQGEVGHVRILPNQRGRSFWPPKLSPMVFCLAILPICSLS